MISVTSLCDVFEWVSSSPSSSIDQVRRFLLLTLNKVIGSYADFIDRYLLLTMSCKVRTSNNS